MDWELKSSPWDFTNDHDPCLPTLIGSNSLSPNNNRGEFSVDLKLGRLDSRRDDNMKLQKSPKRARSISGVQNVTCLVDGCIADLSGCREYHRRYRVCEQHSKTPVVSVGCKEQRFCQQCSRFHSLTEFDDEKRSCRKRLYGHNRLRRKPQSEAFYINHRSFLSNHGVEMESNPTQFPSFFKVLISDYAKKLQIPPAFQEKFDVIIPKNVTIKAKSWASKWPVKVKQVGDSLCFCGDGWEMFVVDTDLKYGDFLIFRLTSNTVFDVAIYGGNGCEKVVFDTKLRDAKTCGYDLDKSDEDEENLTVALCGRPSLQHKSSPARQLFPSLFRNFGESISCRRAVGRPKIGAGKGGKERQKNLCFVVMLKNRHKSYVTIPKAFTYGAGIEEKEFVVLKNKQGKLWPVYLRKRAYNGRIDTGDGWRNFWDDNKLKEKDSCLFKFVSGSGNIIQVEMSLAK